MRSKVPLFIGVIFSILGGIKIFNLFQEYYDFQQQIWIRTDFTEIEFFRFIYGLLFLLIGLFTLTRFLKKLKKEQYLKEHGIPTQGKIIKLEKSPFRVNGVPQINVEMTFLGNTHQLKYISPEFLEGKNIGSMIDIRYNPENLDEFVLVESPIPPSQRASMQQFRRED